MKRLCLLLITATCGWSVANESPGDAAISFLDQVREGAIKLEHGEGTAISEHILDHKRRSIARRLERLGDQLGSGDLVVGRERVEGDLAAVLVWKSNGFDPSQMQVIAIALIKREGEWLPAPVPASFENCEIGYLPKVRKRVNELESWMITGQVNDLAQLREESIARMRKGIEQHLKRESLAAMDQREILRLFLDACERRNAHQIMGLVGGHSGDLPDNWAIRSNCIEAATSNLQSPGPWRLLMSPNVLRVMVDLDDEGGPLHASVACLDPMGSDKSGVSIQLVHLQLVKDSDGLWQVEVPDYFWQDQGKPMAKADERLDRDLLDRFAREVRKQCPAEVGDSADQARKLLISALQQRDFTKVLKIAHIPDKVGQGREAIVNAAKRWGSLHDMVDGDSPSSAYTLIDLAMEVDGQEAAILVHPFSARKPDGYDPDILYLTKTDEGWLWNTNPGDEQLDKFEKWRETTSLAMRKNWRQELLKDCPVVSDLDQKPPTDEEAKAVVERWLKAIESGDVLMALEQCAVLDEDDSPKVLLRNLGYEMIDALRKEGKGSVEHVMSKGPWQGVGTTPRNPDNRSFVFYPVVNTPKGARILLEIDLIASSGRGREFLNRTSLTRAAKLGEEAAKPLTELFEAHRSKCLPDL
ncbi:MAG: hypothetical protein R3242_02235 [Akkermansiaceae bacterium]|nr:hypothetical protein [Akkermansiaceae bacterium]